MKPIKLTDHETLIIFQSLESIWWDSDQIKTVEKLERKLRKAAADNAQLTAWLDKKFAR